MKKVVKDKKKLIISFVAVAFVLAVVAIVVHFATRLTNDSYKNCAVGDVDGNGFINSADALVIDKYLKGSDDLFDSQKKNGDVNLDGNLDELDIEIIQKYATGQIKILPYTEEIKPLQENNNSSLAYEDKDVKSSVQIENSWSNGDGTYSYQLKITVENLDDSRLRNWETKITLSEKVTLSKNWDCESEVDEKTITVKGDTIPSESKMNCGVIVKASEKMKMVSVTTEK